LRAGAMIHGVAPGNHGLRSGGVGGLADADEGAGEEQHGESMDMAGENGGETPKHHAAGNDAGAIEAVGEESERDAAEREDGLQHNLEVADLRAGEREFVTNQGNQGRNSLTISKVDKIDQSKYSKKTQLIGREGDGLG